jgi:hypothetical protein
MFALLERPRTQYSTNVLFWQVRFDSGAQAVYNTGDRLTRSQESGLWQRY